MPDLLVRLYDLDRFAPVASPEAVTVRRAMPYEKSAVVAVAASRFNREWADQAEVTFSRQPPACMIATHAGEVVGFACWDATARGFFGPVGVDPAQRSKGVGAALTRRVLEDMRAAGYGYAIIGGAGSIEFYVRTCGAMEIPGSTPGLYVDRIKPS